MKVTQMGKKIMLAWALSKSVLWNMGHMCCSMKEEEDSVV